MDIHKLLYILILIKKKELFYVTLPNFHIHPVVNKGSKAWGLINNYARKKLNDHKQIKEIIIMNNKVFRNIDIIRNISQSKSIFF
jgi:hypothetical protein